MNTLHIFNPENDIALGNNLRHFTPPRNARLLRDCGSMLMAWIAEDGDIILSDTPGSGNWLHQMTPVLKRNLSLYSADIRDKVTSLSPWGWSNAIAGELESLGFSPDIIPSGNQLDRIRGLSHRRSSVIISRQLREKGFDAPLPVEISSVEELKGYLHDNTASVIKSPWSSSGRGVLYSASMTEDRLLSLAAGMIRNQGSVLAEPLLDKIMDFAMLFEIKAGNARFVGLSVFDTLAAGNYTGNIVASQRHLRDIVCRYTTHTYLDKLASSLEQILSGLIGESYSGICGIDMLAYRDCNGDTRIAPCIELNLRHTMGYVAYCLGRDVIADGLIGRMNVTYTANPSQTPESATPAFDSNNRLTAGSLSLVPPNPYFSIALNIN